MRLSRPCYDKPHRCPGWAGGGTHYASKEDKYRSCDNGSIRYLAPDWYFIKVLPFRWLGHYRLVQFHLVFWWFGRCKKCDVVTWPVITRWLDHGWWKWAFHKWTWRWEDRKYERQWQRENR